MIIDHIGIGISDYDRSKQFYSTVLAPLNIALVIEVQGWSGFGRNGKAEFWFGPDNKIQSPMHIAFLADSREEVVKFHEAAIATGAKDNGRPGIRELYHSNYYGAFVIDPDGYNIEAVCHRGVDA
jgi:catechol 2,3-dioxygenase-like lactoylglutathione lyase family enzyme